MAMLSLSDGDRPSPPHPPMSPVKAPRSPKVRGAFFICASRWYSPLLTFAILHFAAVKSHGSGARLACRRPRVQSLAAKRAVQDEMRAQGIRVSLVPLTQIMAQAREYLAAHPELYQQASEREQRLGSIGWGQRIGAGLSRYENRPQFYQKPQIQEFDYCQRTRSLSQRAYSSSKCLIIRHKVVQRREQFCSPLYDLAFEVTFLDQFDLLVG